MKLRLAHVTATFPPYSAGTGNVCYYNAVELSRRGHEVHVFTAAQPGAPLLEEAEGVRIHRLRPLIRIGNMPVLPELAAALSGFDLIHLHYPFILGAEIVRFAAAVSKTPLVVTFHNDLIGNGARARVFRLYQSLSARLALKSADCLCVLSQDHYLSSTLRSDLDGHPLRIVELPNGVDLTTFAPGEADAGIRQRFPEGTKVVFFIAALDRAHHFKGLETLLQSFRSIPEEVRLLVAGDGDIRLDYEKLARDLGISERVVFAGAVSHAETPRLFRSAHVTVLPSSPPESFGLVLIESLACGVPVVASCIPGVRTVVDDGQDGLFVEPGDPAALASAILTILENDAARREMGRKGRLKVARRYDWGEIGAQLERIYFQVAGIS